MANTTMEIRIRETIITTAATITPVLDETTEDDDVVGPVVEVVEGAGSGSVGIILYVDGSLTMEPRPKCLEN